MRSRRSVRLAAVGTAALVAGVLPGSHSAASGEQGELSLSYACQFATGEQDVTVAFTQQFPQTAAVGKPITPGDLTMSVAIPRAGVTAMLPAGTTSVTADGDLKAHVTQGTSAADADWSGLTAPDTPVAGTDDLIVALTGKVPGVTVSAAGDVAFAVGELALTLHPEQAATSTPSTPDPGASSPGAAAADGTTADGTAKPATAPATDGTAADASAAGLTGTCTPKPDQDATLATVHVPGAPSLPGGPGSSGTGTGVTGHGGTSTGHGSSASRPAAGSPGSGASPDKKSTIVPLDSPPHSGVHNCGKLPTGKLDPKRLPPYKSDTAVILPMPGQPELPDGPLCGFAVGFSNVNKLNGAMIINDPHAKPAMAEVNGRRRLVLDYGKQYIEVDSVMDMTLPPSHSTFLTYGFMPTTADVEFVPRGVFTIVQTGDAFFDEPIVTTIGGYQDIRIHNVRINGTPLDVGPNCHTATPLDIVLNGRNDDYIPGGDGKPDYYLFNGGPLRDDDLVIPPFTGCTAHGENLNALFTSALSGPGNSLNLSQGALCDPVSNYEGSCLPEIQLPELPKRKS